MWSKYINQKKEKSLSGEKYKSTKCSLQETYFKFNDMWAKCKSMRKYTLLILKRGQEWLYLCLVK